MKLAIMQPYFFPYLGYLQLMSVVDRWVVFDDIQFIDKGWINRNRILHPDQKKDWQYITIPLKKKGRFDKISEISISEDPKWKETILGKLTSYKRSAPYYNQTIDFVRDCLSQNEINLSNFLVSSLRKTAERLGLEIVIDVQSEMSLELTHIHHPGQWALRLSQQLNADEYINPYSGFEIFNNDEFEFAGIKLTFLRSRLDEYVQRRGRFVPGLSLVDVMMWNSDKEIESMLRNGYDLLDMNTVRSLV